MEEKMVLLENRKSRPYTIGHESLRGGKFQFPPAKNGKPYQKEMSEEIIDFLRRGSCFEKGNLYIVDKEYRDEVITEQELLNSHTRDEVLAMLEGTLANLKEAVKGISSDNEKSFIFEVAKEIKLDSKGKRKFLLKWLGLEETNEDLFFGDDED